jgi:hypothetical protein
VGCSWTLPFRRSPAQPSGTFSIDYSTSLRAHRSYVEVVKSRPSQLSRWSPPCRWQAAAGGSPAVQFVSSPLVILFHVDRPSSEIGDGPIQAQTSKQSWPKSSMRAVQNPVWNSHVRSTGAVMSQSFGGSPVAKNLPGQDIEQQRTAQEPPPPRSPYLWQSHTSVKRKGKQTHVMVQQPSALGTWHHFFRARVAGKCFNCFT